MGKIEELKKKLDRLEKELHKANIAYEKQAEIIKKKQANIDQINMDIVSQLLVEKNMNMKDLMAILGKEQPVNYPTQDEIHNNLDGDYSNVGGETDEV